jgi:hypothetical protein
MMLSQELLLQLLPGLKKDKTRIILAFCINTTGLNWFPVWIIGKVQTPCALQRINISILGTE